jgi:hypothetical protein
MSKLGEAIGRVRATEVELAGAFATVAERHVADPDVFHLCTLFAEESQEQADLLAPHAERYGDGEMRRPNELEPEGKDEGTRLLSDLSRLLVLAQRCGNEATIVRQAALANRDQQLLTTISACHAETAAQVKWLQTRIRVTAPQALTVD